MDTKITVKSFNQHNVYRLLDIPNPYIQDYELAKIYRKFSYLTFGVIDRTGGMKHFLNVEPQYPIPDYNPNFTKSFSTICLERAQDIIKKDKDIYVLWSGGLDSTTIVASLMASDVDSNRVVICMTPDSLKESGNIYDTVISKRFPRYILENPTIERLVKRIPIDAILVHGMNGNSIMGVEPYHVQEFMFDFPYENFVHKDLVEFYRPAIEKFSIPIKTVKQFWNFNSFNMFWHANHYHFHRFISNPERIEDFFIEEFQDWYISGKESGYQKVPMRNFIREVFGPKSKTYVETKKIRYSFIADDSNLVLYTSDNKTISTHDI